MARVRELVWPSRIPEEEWEAISQGIPAKDEPFIERYLGGREALILQEKKQRSGRYPALISTSALTPFTDYGFRVGLSPLAKEACAIVDRIRDEEQRTIWVPEFEDHLAQKIKTNIYPGMMFGLAKERMETTKLWKIMRKMPKGALLHAHMDAMVDFDYLFDVLLETKGMHIHCMSPLSNPTELDYGPVKFRFYKEEKGIFIAKLQESMLIKYRK